MSKRDTITARRLVLVDDEGNERIVLDASWPDGFASIDLMSKSGAAIKLWVDGDGIPKVAVQRPNSRYAMTFALGENEEPTLTFYDRDGLPMIRLGPSLDDGAPTIETLRKGRRAWASPGKEAPPITKARPQSRKRKTQTGKREPRRSKPSDPKPGSK